MKAAVYYETGAPDVLRYEDVPDPVCHPQGVVIRVEAVSIEGGDTLNRGGGQMAGSPHIVGYQAAGEIVEVGAEVSHMKVGQKVVTVNAFGSHAELRAVPARNAWPIPDGFDIQKASAIPVPFGTAHECLFGAGRLKAGETVLVQAGAGAVGLAAIQLAKQAGATVLASASSDERLQRLTAFGMDHGINYRRDDLVEQVMKLTGGKGVDLVVDPVGGATLQGSLGALGYRGRISLVGNAGREPMKVDVSSLMGGNRSLTGVFLGAEIMTDRVHDMIQDLIDRAAKGELEVVIDKTFPLSEAAAAHAYIESRQAVGRVLLVP
ncbi:quinone oxidoreductase family protein [Caulobacter sp. RL271]|jgi:NADPH2:quinone reductase|uniref:Zinc-binding alcohol dehydrogenase family protein n=1 Tax=Caulobacter segnis TaxID=88688 RepID=A0ABY4ZPU8_9CAUL|nr:zinc-binding alcohol dehydrogenase family protein [Caulobacter segnis]USQ94032.1 zinc-binding alcohol dehydrogenase family protein [Caulobacter segnis]